MRNVVRFLAVVLAVVSIVSVIGCSSGSKPSGSAKDRAVSMMKVLPANVSGFSYMDIYTLRTDANLASEWEILMQQSNDSAVLKKINGLGLVYAESIALFVGDFSLEELTEVASNGSYEYGGFTVKTYGENVSAALVNSVAINSLDDQIKRCIDVAKGTEASMYGSEDLQAVLARLPEGYMMDAWVVGNETVPEGFEGLLAVAEITTRQGSDDMQTTVYKFNGSDAAQKYAVAANNASQDESYNVAVTQDGAFVKVAATPVTATPTPAATVALTPKPTATPVVTVTPTP